MDIQEGLTRKENTMTLKELKERAARKGLKIRSTSVKKYKYFIYSGDGRTKMYARNLTEVAYLLKRAT